MINYIFLNVLNIIILLILVLVGIAFLTLLERKILRYVQDRKGPNKLGILGLFQPIADGVKLFFKELFFIYKSNQYLYYFSPILRIIIILRVWNIYPYITNVYFINYSILIILVFIRVGRYVLLIMGWSSNSIYSMLGSLRSVSQIISYEVRFIIIILCLMIFNERYSIIDFLKWQIYLRYIVYICPLFLVFFIRVLAELNRRPMDFIEGESELVSGFNVEYFRGGFALIFLREYGIIIFIGLLIVWFFLGVEDCFSIYIFLNLLVSLIIFIRGLIPRMRYDELIYLCWKIILPMILNYFFLVLGIKYFLIKIVYKFIENLDFFNMFSKHKLIQVHKLKLN